MEFTILALLSSSCASEFLGDFEIINTGAPKSFGSFQFPITKKGQQLTEYLNRHIEALAIIFYLDVARLTRRMEIAKKFEIRRQGYDQNESFEIGIFLLGNFTFTCVFCFST